MTYWDQGRHKTPIIERILKTNCYTKSNIARSNNEEVERYARFPKFGEFQKWLKWRNKISSER